ncbi:MAG: DUF1553 domain-containing protein [Bacteroidota bacterium]
MNSLTRYTLGLVTALIFLAACGPVLPPGIEAEFASLPEEIDYNFHVKPILSDRCFACHGPDAQNRSAELRLDTEEGAYAALESGAGHAIVPGKLGRSALVDRILSADPEELMPPPESNLELTEAEKATLVRWIEQGAVYKAHWAFETPEKPSLPPTENDWARNEVDQFIAAKLERAGIEASPEATKEMLIRRLFFDLNGLPPTLSELDQWVADDGPDAYDRLVEELMARPAFGERMAAHWLDVARFADSEGYLDDFHHEFWPYRDWVIKAFQENLPYDQFILWQMGGDQLPEPTTDQILATAFNRNHKQNSEGGIIPEEFRVEYVADRTNTLGAAFMGLTLGCARCHDHKYDPISQEDYFQLFSFFNSTVERGDGIFAFNAVENGQMVSNELSMNAGPVLALPSEEVQEIRAYLLQQIDQTQDSLSSLAQNNSEALEAWKSQQRTSQALEQAIQASTVTHLTFDQMANGKDRDLVRSNEVPSYWGEVKPVSGKFGQAVRSDASGQYLADGSLSSFERNEPFTISFWIQIPKDFARAHVMYNGNNRIQGYRGWDVILDSSRVHLRLNHAHPYQSLDVMVPEPLKVGEWAHFVWTYDGSSKAKGMKVYQNGEPISVSIERDHLYRSTKPYTDTRATVYMPYRGIIIGNRHYDQDFTGGLIDEVRILNREGDALVAQYLYDQAAGKNAFEEAVVASGSQIGTFFDLMIDPKLEQGREALRAIQAREIQTIDTVQEIMVMGDRERERPTYILDRGVYDAHGERVDRAVPESILPWSEDLPKNRLGLGRWLIDPEHPLTARVAVNQMWHLMFGRGLVETVEDFGNQGALPSHPELLDWLAVDFVENGWDVQRLIRQMVTSATYRQSSHIRPELLELDPDNLLLARGPRYRRSAEMVRDNVLASSGLLDEQVGGPSTFPYQPAGLWKETTSHPFFPGYQVDQERGLYRRSIYTFWKRNMPPPSMLIFDAANRGECQVRRQRSNTPLQALVLLNDPQMIEGCRALAEKVLTEQQGSIASALEQAFRLLTSRQPNEREQALLQQQFEAELAYFEADPQQATAYLAVGQYRLSPTFPPNQIAALARVSNTILNTTEAYYKN